MIYIFFLLKHVCNSCTFICSLLNDGVKIQEFLLIFCPYIIGFRVRDLLNLLFYCDIAIAILM